MRSLANSTRYDQALLDLSKLRRIQGTELNEDPKAESFVKSILALVNDVILLKNNFCDFFQERSCIHIATPLHFFGMCVCVCFVLWCFVCVFFAFLVRFF